MKWKGRGNRTFLSFLKFSIRKTQGQEVGSFFNSFEMIRWRQPERTFNYMMRGRKGGRERKGPGRTCFYMLNDEEENGKLKGKMAFKQITWEWNTKSTRGECGHFMLETKAAATWSSPQPPPPPHLPSPAAVMGDALWCRVSEISPSPQPAHVTTGHGRGQQGPWRGAGSAAQGHRIKPSFYATF